MSRSSSQAMKSGGQPASSQFAMRQFNIDPRSPDSSLENPKSIETQVEKQESLPVQLTPVYQSSSSGLVSSLQSTRWTPKYLARSLVVSQKLGSGKGSIPLTPHGRAAQHQLHLRTGLMLGGGRRKSGRNQQRETPRDNLRALSRLLAPKSQLIIPTPESSAPSKSKDTEEEEDESDLIRPRFSLAPDDDDDSFLLPPESADLEDENITVRSVEMPRRAVSEQPYSRISRGSFGGVRLSDVFTEPSNVGIKGDADESGYTVNFRRDDPSILAENYEEALRDDTGTMRFAMTHGDRLSPMGQESGIRQAPIVTDENDTFFFTVPSRMSPGILKTEESPSLPNIQIGGSLGNETLLTEMNFNSQGASNSTDVESDSQNLTAQGDNLEVSYTRPLRRKKVKLSQYGIPYPSLPTRVVKSLAITFAKTAGIKRPRINKETIGALMQATDWFFEQASDDLRAYAMHAGRKTIEDSDITTLMKRQRQINSTTTPFFLAQRYLPRELLQELRMTNRSSFK